MQIQLNSFGRILRGPQREACCHLTKDDQVDGYFVVVYQYPDTASTVLLSEWLPTLEALNYFLREQDWALTWIDQEAGADS